MKNTTSSILLSLLTFMFVIFVPHLSQAQPFSRIVFFGDSLTDNGNLYAFLLQYMPKSPPYHEGRFTDGPVWSDFVNQYYALPTDNYAVGGQTAIYHNPFEGYLPYPLSFSLNSYVLRTLGTDRSTSLFIIWEGANDYLTGVKNTDELTTNVIASIKYTIENLIYYGGKNIIVINLPDLSHIPFSNNNPNKEMLHNATTIHNLKLEAAIAELQAAYKDATINLYSMYDLFNDFTTHVDAYNKKYQTHVKNTSESCWAGGYTFTKQKISEAMIMQQIDNHMYVQSKALTASNANQLNGNEIASAIIKSPALFEAYQVSMLAATGVTPCEHPDDYMFWDAVHPTTIAHKVIYLNMIEFINQHYQIEK